MQPLPHVVVKRKRGRPRKNPLPEAVQEEVQAAQSLCELPICTSPIVRRRRMAEEREKLAELKWRECFIAGLEAFSAAEGLQRAIAKGIREDPRTEELKELKKAVEDTANDVKLLKTIDAAQAQEDRQLIENVKQMGEEIIKLKRTAASELPEPLQKRFAQMEAGQKAIQTRICAVEDRLKAVEMK